MSTLCYIKMIFLLKLPEFWKTLLSFCQTHLEENQHTIVELMEV